MKNKILFSFALMIIALASFSTLSYSAEVYMDEPININDLNPEIMPADYAKGVNKSWGLFTLYAKPDPYPTADSHFLLVVGVPTITYYNNIFNENYDYAYVYLFDYTTGSRYGIGFINKYQAYYDELKGMKDGFKYAVVIEAPFYSTIDAKAIKMPVLKNKAQFISQNVPTTLKPNQQFTATIKFKNNGDKTWIKGEYKLGSQNPQDNQIWGTGRIQLPHDVAPGSQVTFSKVLKAPANNGIYNFQWRMVQEHVEWFGQFSTNVRIAVGVSQINDAQFISQSFPAVIERGEFFTGWVIFKNTGTTTWIKGSYKLGSQNPQDNYTWGVNRIEIPNNVAPSQQVKIYLHLEAPYKMGVYNCQWKMLQVGVQWFGQKTTNKKIRIKRIKFPDVPYPIDR